MDRLTGRLLNNVNSIATYCQIKKTVSRLHYLYHLTDQINVEEEIRNKKFILLPQKHNVSKNLLSSAIIKYMRQRCVRNKFKESLKAI